MRYAALDATACKPHRETVGVVIAACSLSVFRCGLPAEFAAPHNEGAVEHAPAFEVCQQSSDRLIGVAGMFGVVADNIGMSIPVIVVVRSARINLDEPRAAFYQTSGEKAFAAKIVGPFIANTIKIKGFLVFTGKIDGFRRARLHFVREFITGDAGC